MMTQQSDRMSWWSSSLAVALLLATSLAACKPADDAADEPAESRFSAELVEVGIRFDEPVRVGEGAVAAVEPSESTSVMLTQNGEDGSFSASLEAADTSGNESETRLEARVRLVPAAE